MNFRELRRGMIIVANTIEKLEKSRELSSTKTSAQKTMMWTGTFMKFAELGDNPYAKHDGNRKTVKDIEPLFDATNETFNREVMQAGLITIVDTMRTYIAEYLEGILAYMTDTSRISKTEANYTPEQIIQTNMCLFNIYTNLTETRMWLGMELGRIRDKNNA